MKTTKNSHCCAAQRALNKVQSCIKEYSNAGLSVSFNLFFPLVSLYIFFFFCDLSHFCNIDAPFSFQNLFYTYLALHWKKVSVINVLKLDIVLFCICLFLCYSLLGRVCVGILAYCLLVLKMQLFSFGLLTFWCQNKCLWYIHYYSKVWGS